MKKNYKRNWRFKVRSIALLGFLILAGSSSAQLNGIYTVDSLSPSSVTNFQSFLDLADSLEALGVSGPVTINVVPGSGPYLGTFEFDGDDVTGVSAANSITINGNGEEIVGNTRAVDIDEVSYLTFRNVVFRTTSTGNSQTVRFGSSVDNLIIDSCEIIGVTNPGAFPSNQSNYLELTGGAGLFNGNEDITNVQITNCKLWNGGTAGAGAYTALVLNQPNSNSDDQNILISNNEILDFSVYGLRMEYLSGVIIENNVVRSQATINRGFNTSYGMYVQISDFQGFDPDEKVVVRGNKIYQVGGNPTSTFADEYGLWMQIEESDVEVDVYNNSIDIENAGSRYGMRIDGDGFPDFSGTCNIWNNTVMMQGLGIPVLLIGRVLAVRLIHTV